MYISDTGRQERVSQDSLLTKAFAVVRAHATAANLVGLSGIVLALFCFIALPGSQNSNIRVPLYLAVTIWTILRPRVALYLLPIAVPWSSLDSSVDIINLGGLNLSSADILVVLLTVSWLLGFVLRPYVEQGTTLAGPLDREGFNVPRYLVLAMLLLLLTMLLSMMTTFSMRSSLKEISKWLELVTVVLLGAQYIRTRRQVWTLIVIICLAGVSQAIYGYIQEFFNLGPDAFVRFAGLRAYGTFGQPNPYAGYINMSLTMALALTLLGGNWRTRILAGFVTVLLGGAEYLSQSLGGEIAIAAAILLIVTIGIPRIRMLIGAGAIVGLGIFGAALVGFVPQRLTTPVLSRLGFAQVSFTAPSPQNFSTAERLAHWIAGINMFLDHPFLGVGIGNFPDVYHKYAPGIFVNSLGHAHNYYINMAAEAGAPGLLAFVLFLVAIFVAGGRSYRAINKKYIQGTTAQKTGVLLEMLTNDRVLAIGLLAALLSVCVHNVVDNLYVHSMANLFALLLVVLIRLEGVTSNVKQYGG